MEEDLKAMGEDSDRSTSRTDGDPEQSVLRVQDQRQRGTKETSSSYGGKKLLPKRRHERSRDFFNRSSSWFHLIPAIPQRREETPAGAVRLEDCIPASKAFYQRST